MYLSLSADCICQRTVRTVRTQVVFFSIPSERTRKAHLMNTSCESDAIEGILLFLFFTMDWFTQFTSPDGC